MNPEQIAKSGLEHGEQAALLAWCAMAARFGDHLANLMTTYDGRMAKELPNEFAIPQLKLLFAINNAVGRNSVQHGARNKAEGVKSGIPDLLLPVAKIYSVKRKPDLALNVLGQYEITQHHGLFVEMKRRSAYSETNQLAGTSTEQKHWIGALAVEQYAVAVCYGWQHARDTILQYLRG